LAPLLLRAIHFGGPAENPEEVPMPIFTLLCKPIVRELVAALAVAAVDAACSSGSSSGSKRKKEEGAEEEAGGEQAVARGTRSPCRCASQLFHHAVHPGGGPVLEESRGLLPFMGLAPEEHHHDERGEEEDLRCSRRAVPGRGHRAHRRAHHGPWVLAGIGVGAGIHGYVPEGVLAGIMGKQAWWSVPAAVAIGVPMYSNAAGIIPVVEALLGKGAALGTVLAFMMAVIGLSLPEIVILRKVLRPRLIATFVGLVASGILMVGWLFNAVL
jgi:uncharacterized membrane protein YraQ (UPF0718 family)